MITTGENLPATAHDPNAIHNAIEKRRNVGGRPALYTPELAANVLERVANGETITKICAEKEMPSWPVVWDWIKHVQGFATAYAHAKEGKAHFYAESGVDILSEAPTTSMADVRKAEAQANYRLSLAKCYDRETYGDKVQQDVNIKGVMIQTSCKELQDLLNGG